tara:strand:+ start:1184 stop:2329 length:1146 start_codon:yes stop_codon:yes gene_type:complete
MDKFYLIVTPGLEDLAQKELLRWAPLIESEISHGGVHFEVPRRVGLELNQCLKIPTRILMRLSEFRCRDFPKLFKKTSELPWEEWIHPNVQVEVVASSSKSRLNIKKRIQSTVEEGFLAFQKKKKISAGSESAKIYVRLFEDICTLSVDTSGERLHKRSSVGKHVGIAPLRETLAAAMLEDLLEGLTGNFQLIDPMVGSGTFLMEAALKNKPLGKDFSSLVLANSQEDSSTEESFKIEEPTSPWNLEKLKGFEFDQKTLHAAQRNLEQMNLSIPFLLRRENVFEMKPLPTPDESRLVVCNPPYGERIKISGSIKFYYERLFQVIDRNFSPFRASFMLPTQKIKGRLQLPENWKVLRKTKTTNGGLSVTIYLFECLQNKKNS